MRIVHICLAASYVEGMGYQENILPQYHVIMGNSVLVLTTDRIFNSKYELVKRKENDYVNEYGVKVKVLSEGHRYGWLSRFGDFVNLYQELDRFRPDVIFVHNGQFIGLFDVIRYCKQYGARLYIDQHSDYYNTPINTWKKKLVHCYIYGTALRKAVPYVSRFWGVTPWRCQYLKEIYHIPNDKIDLLVMGGDDRFIGMNKKAQTRAEIRKKLSINDDDFVIVTGGKIDKTKNIHLLAQAIQRINDERVKLIIFGQPNNEMADEISNLSLNPCVINLGWISANEVYSFYLASDLAVFPGTHSVLWEQACACKIPCLVKRWEGMEHVNNGGNCDFIDDVSVEGIQNKIQELYFTEKYYSMKKIAESEATDIFLYSKIAEKSIECYKA